MTKVILSIEPIRFPLTGIGRYTFELAKALLELRCLEDLRLFGAAGFVEGLPQAEERSSGTHRLKGLIQGSRLASEAYRHLMPLVKRRALRHCQDYLYHGPNFYLPPFPGRRVATFHDLSPFTWPQCAPPERVRFMRKELLLAVDRADAFITDAEFNRQELADYFSIPLDKIHAVPLACGAEFKPRQDWEIHSTLANYGLAPGGYSLYVGTLEPRKNLLNLLSAYEHLPLQLRRRWPLILSGYRGWQSDEIHCAVAVAERQGWARYLGYVPTADLPLLFAGARLFCFPSLYEGFGLPVLEAMSSGVPVVCSNNSSLPEVAGNVALMTAADDVEMLGEIIRRGLEDEQWRSQARQAGLTRAQSFTWQRCASSTLQVYQNVMKH